MFRTTDDVLYMKYSLYEKEVGKINDKDRKNAIGEVEGELYLLSPSSKFDNSIRESNSSLKHSCITTGILALVIIFSVIMSKIVFENFFMMIIFFSTTALLISTVFTIIMYINKHFNRHKITTKKIINLDYTKYDILKKNYPHNLNNFYEALIDSIIFKTPEADKVVKILLDKTERIANEEQKTKKAKWENIIIQENIINDLL